MSEKEMTLNRVASMIEDNGKNIISQMKVLMEGMGKDIRLVAEGHGIIRREMQEMKSELKADIKEVNDKLEFVAEELGGKIDKIDRTLSEHTKLPAHMCV